MTESFAPRDYNESSDVEPPIAVGEERDDVTGEPIGLTESEGEKRPPLDPEMAELVKEKRDTNKGKLETVIELDGRKLS